MAKATSEELVLITPQQIELITETIETELAVKNITDQAIQKYRNEALALKINGPDDKAGYELVYKKRQEGKKTRIAAAEICKAGREPLQAKVELWIKKQTEITIAIKEAEAHLLGQEQFYEAAKQKIEDEKNAVIEARLKERGKVLTALGATFNGVDYILEEKQFSLSEIKGCGDEYFNDKIVAEFKEVFMMKEDARIAKKKIEDEAEALRQQEAEKLKAAQLKLKEDQAKIDFENAEIEKKNNAERERLRLAAQKESDDKLKARLNQLVSLGLKYDFNTGYYVNFDVFIHTIDITGKDDEEWEKMLTGTKIHIAKWKENEAANEAARIEREKQEAIENAEIERKAKLAADELKRKQDLEIAGDKAKYAEVVAYIKATPVYDVRSGQYRSKMLIVRNFIDDLK